MTETSPDQYSKLAPRDLVITMRSLSRRFSEALGPVRSDPERFARRDEVIDGQSLTGHVAGLARQMNLLETEIGRIISGYEPTINGDALKSEVPAPPDRVMGLDAAESSLVASAETIGGLIDGASGEQWSFRAPATHGAKVTMLELVQHAARIGANGIRSTTARAHRL